MTTVPFSFSSSQYLQEIYYVNYESEALAIPTIQARTASEGLFQVTTLFHVTRRLSPSCVYVCGEKDKTSSLIPVTRGRP